MSETPDTVGIPAQPRLVCMELWRPLRYAIERRGPYYFWRECLPVRMPDGWHIGPSGERVPNPPRFIWAKPTEWRVLDREVARNLSQLPNEFFTLDEYPGVTFCVRKFRGPSLDDWRQVQKLRLRDALPTMIAPGGLQ